MEEKQLHNRFSEGFRDGIPIGLGYLSVSFTFGMMAVSMGLPVWAAVVISFTNVTSAGQFAGLSILTAGSPLLEMALTQLVINSRYALMSLSLSQKLHRSISRAERFLIAFGITDEIFAVSSGKCGEVGTRYMLGLMSMPIVGWSLGTFVGAAASSILPEFIRSALGIAIYGMFIAIIVPPARHIRPVGIVVAAAVTLSCLFTYTPVLNQVSGGFVIILCAVAAAAFGAKLYPVEERSQSDA